MAYFFDPAIRLVGPKARRAVKVQEDTKSPAPIFVAASQEFDGNGRPWSSFTVQVGTPPQYVKVLISTASYQTLVVVPKGCTPLDPRNCASSKGGEFISSLSSTWRVNNITANGTFTLDLEGNLGNSGNGDYGFDTIEMSWQGSGAPSLKQQIVGKIATKEFYLGIFGLDPKVTNFYNSVPSYIGIEWDEEVQAYLVNDTLHSALQSENLTVTFSLGDRSKGPMVDISLPYPAFDLTASYPLVTNGSRYFPLMRATNESQYTLGRTFLQEAYVIANYERHSLFDDAIHPCGGRTNNVAITHGQTAAAERTNVAITHGQTAAAERTNVAITHGQIIGMSIGSVTSAILMLLIAGIKLKRYIYSRKAVPQEVELHPLESGPPFGASREHELDGEGHYGMEIDGVRLPGHEIGGDYGHELSDNEWIFELYGDDVHN